MITKLWKPLSPKCRVYDAYSIIISRNLGVIVCNIVDPSNMVEDHDDTWVQTSNILSCLMSLICKVFGKHLLVDHLGVQ